MTFLLALTGSIGMGKSTTARIFADRGVKVWDADQAVHRLYGTDGAGTKVVTDLYPAAVTALGVNRDALRDGLRANPDLLKELQARVHPFVAQDRAEFIAANKDADILLFDIPLVFELGNEAAFHAVAVVSVDAATQ
ncbi:MAG: dephospho-CoA kinase, partial [Pseudomonadota bacterium]